MAAALRLHRPRRDPARASGLAVSRSRGQLRLRQARALEACHRAGVEVVIMSGRREAQVRSDARLIGQTLLHLRGRLRGDDRRRAHLPHRRLGARRGRHAGRADARRRASRSCCSSTSRARLEWHAPWHTGRELSLLMRGKVDVGEANELIARARPRRPALPRQRRDRPADGGDRRPAHAYHLVPGGASKAKAVAFHMRARGYAPRSASRIGDSIEDLEAAESVGPLLLRRQRPRARRGAARGAAALRQRRP